MKKGIFTCGCLFALITALPGATTDDPIRSPAYFWLWNDALTPKTLLAQLDEMNAQGVRNVCIHPLPKKFRPVSCPSKMDPDYLTPGFFDAIAQVVDYAGKLGMHAYLYDEGGWPSGGACGCFAASDKEGRFRQRVIRANGSVDILPYRGSAPYPSLIEKGATERFIALTHEGYARAVPNALGKTMKIAFTDEPVRPANLAGEHLGWASDFAEVFRAKKGYDIVPHVGDLIKRGHETSDQLARWRIDYNDVMADLFVERFALPLRNWCRAHDMLSGGHYNGEDEPERTADFGHGSLMRSLRAMDAPGVDVIWRQLAPPKPYRRPVTAPFPRYAASAMHQNGGTYALSETFGIYGDSLTPAEMKWVIDFQMVRGINTFVFGYYPMSTAEQWMLMFEPLSGPVSPLWKHQKDYFSYIERMCRQLSRGKPGAEIAVLYDVRGIWAGGADREAAVGAHYAVAKALDRLHDDYDFVDDDSIAEATVTADGKLQVGAMAYRAIVLPTSKWMRPDAREKLESLRRAGGLVVTGTDLTPLPQTLDVAGDRTGGVRVLKRLDGKKTLYFVFVEDSWDPEVELQLNFTEGGRVVRYCPATDTYETAGRNGIVRGLFARGETALFEVGEVPEAAAPKQAVGPSASLASGWTLRKAVSHEIGSRDIEIRPCNDAPVPTALGDWREMLGARFSGQAVYRVEFDAVDGLAEIDLGTVCWSAAVRVNGVELGAKCFPPYRWQTVLRTGRNVLEVTVANTLANLLGHDDVRERLARAYPPLSSYDRWQRPFDRENQESGLFGPVKVMPIR